MSPAAHFPGLEEIETWARAGTSTVDPDALADVGGAVATAAVAADRERLTALRDRITPAAAALDRRLTRARIDPWITQAARVTTLAAVTRGALRAIDRARPDEVLAQIPLGREILLALRSLADPADPGGYIPVELGALRDAIDVAGEPPSKPRISRALTSLGLNRFVHLIGATRNRKCALLSAADRALGPVAADTPAPAPPEPPPPPTVTTASATRPDAAPVSALDPPAARRSYAAHRVGNIPGRAFLRAVG